MQCLETASSFEVFFLLAQRNAGNLVSALVRASERLGLLLTQSIAFSFNDLTYSTGRKMNPLCTILKCCINLKTLNKQT